MWRNVVIGSEVGSFFLLALSLSPSALCVPSGGVKRLTRVVIEVRPNVVSMSAVDHNI